MIFAVIVSFNPAPGELDALVARVRPQVEGVVLVDNASSGLQLNDPGDAQVIVNSRNEGLAAALNQGIRAALDRGADFVLLLDQDSEPASDMVAQLRKAHDELSVNSRMAAVGPKFVDARNGEGQPFVRIGFPFNQRLSAQDDVPIRADYLITSGSLISRDALLEIGLMDETLFIDNIDMDWSFRAASLGFELFGVPSATMMHRIGDDLFRMPLGMGDVMVHSPRRLYYSSRNRVLLYRRPYVSKTWIAQDLPRFALKFARLVLFVNPRAQIARGMLLGLFDGIKGRSGPVTHRFG